MFGKIKRHAKRRSEMTRLGRAMEIINQSLDEIEDRLDIDDYDTIIFIRYAFSKSIIDRIDKFDLGNMSIYWVTFMSRKNIHVLELVTYFLTRFDILGKYYNVVDEFGLIDDKKEIYYEIERRLVDDEVIKKFELSF